MAIRFYQLGDYDNTLLRKTLENDSQAIAGNQTISIRGAGGSATPRFFEQGDGKNTILRKILENLSQTIAGTMTVYVR